MTTRDVTWLPEVLLSQNAKNRPMLHSTRTKTAQIPKIALLGRKLTKCKCQCLIMKICTVELFSNIRSVCENRKQ